MTDSDRIVCLFACLLVLFVSVICGDDDVRVVLALDELWDPQNFGALIRTSHFLGVERVIVCAKNSAPLNAVVSKCSSGAMELHPVYSTNNMMRFLDASKANGWQVIGAAISADALPITQLSLDKPTILVLGNEGHGIRTNVVRRCDQLVKIDRSASANAEVDSLNVSVCGGILLHRMLFKNQ
jgi:21S rRNA (GM2251-2'-O)-methyltransferase